MFDDRIDRAARRLTSGLPREDFRSRVLDRIEGSGHRRPVVWWSLAAAAAIFIVAIGLVKHENVAHAPASARSSAGVATLPAPPALSEQSESKGPAPPAPPALSEQSESKGPALPAPPAPGATERVASGEPAEASALPQGFDPIASERLVVESIDIIRLDAPASMPVLALSIAQLDIPPLDVSPAGQQ